MSDGNFNGLREEDVAQEIVFENEPVLEDDMEQESDPDAIHLDMSNNSTTYFDKHTDSIFLIASHPSLPLVVSGGGDDMGYLWTTHSNPPRLATELSGHTDSLITGGFSYNGEYLVTGDMNGQVRVWRSQRGGEQWEFITCFREVDEVVWIRFHPSQPYFAVGALDGSVWTYLMEGGKISNISVHSLHSKTTNDGLFVDTSNEEKLTLVSISEDGSIVIWDVFRSVAIVTLGEAEFHGIHCWVSMSLSPSERTFIVGSLDGQLSVIKSADGQVLHLLNTAENIDDEDGQSIETVSCSNTVPLLAAGNVNGDVFLFDVTTWRLRSHFKLSNAITKLQFIPGTSHLVCSAIDSTLAVYDALTCDVVWSCLGHSEGVLGFALQNNGRRIISAGDDGVCLIFNQPDYLGQAVA